ncbi:hypothetical protein AVEN_51587-1 [Araneus ventricosus]|uniref:Uncharacterized protein n=1 Tax=Araneus ventricosus TaxID=182803 RepID=A0A4Y2LEI7_ARAVE|nr:hypothetical protein AVEN_51587-1 [Araneus ventricosus]
MEQISVAGGRNLALKVIATDTQKPQWDSKKYHFYPTGSSPFFMVLEQHAKGGHFKIFLTFYSERVLPEKQKEWVAAIDTPQVGHGELPQNPIPVNA